jgi:hypothetical protein
MQLDVFWRENEVAPQVTLPKTLPKAGLPRTGIFVQAFDRGDS